MVAMALSHSRLWLSELRRPARLLTVGQDVDLAEAVRVADATTRIRGRPNLVLHARLPARIRASYDLPGDDRAALGGLDGPVLVSRTVADDGTGQDTDAVWLVRWPEPADVAALAALWSGRGDLTCCVAASCLGDPDWSAAWLPVLGNAGPLIWLIDVPVESLTANFRPGQTMHGVYLDLDLATSGACAVAFKVPGHAGAWLAVADDVGVQLITQQVADLPGADLQMTGADWTQATPALRLVLLDLLRTESHLDLRAWSDQRAWSGPGR